MIAQGPAAAARRRCVDGYAASERREDHEQRLRAQGHIGNRPELGDRIAAQRRVRSADGRDTRVFMPPMATIFRCRRCSSMRIKRRRRAMGSGSAPPLPQPCWRTSPVRDRRTSRRRGRAEMTPRRTRPWQSRGPSRVPVFRIRLRRRRGTVPNDDRDMHGPGKQSDDLFEFCQGRR